MCASNHTSKRNSFTQQLHPPIFLYLWRANSLINFDLRITKPGGAPLFEWTRRVVSNKIWWKCVAEWFEVCVPTIQLKCWSISPGGEFFIVSTWKNATLLKNNLKIHISRRPKNYEKNPVDLAVQKHRILR